MSSECDHPTAVKVPEHIGNGWFCPECDQRFASTQEYIDSAVYEVRCPDCDALVATERGSNAIHARRDAVTFPCEPCARRRG